MRGDVWYGGHPRGLRPAPPDFSTPGNLALVVADSWCLPAMLAAALPPDPESDIPETSYTDADGLYVVGRNELLF